MGSIREFLKGKKTYVLSLVTLIGILASYFVGDITGQQAFQGAMESLMAATIRAGIGSSSS